jgi:hypothetical protein
MKSGAASEPLASLKCVVGGKDLAWKAAELPCGAPAPCSGWWGNARQRQGGRLNTSRLGDKLASQPRRNWCIRCFWPRAVAMGVEELPVVRKRLWCQGLILSWCLPSQAP